MYTDDEVTQRLQEEAAKRGVTFDQSDVEDVRRRDNSDEGIAAALKKYDFRSDNTPNSGDNNDGRTNPWQAPTSSASQSPAQAWNSAPQAQASSSSIFPDWYKELMTRQIGMQEQQQTENKSRADSLYSTLNTRATQGLNVSATDPVIRPQVDAFRAEQDRAGRNFIKDTAEQAGPLANIQGERRMAAEKAGQATSGFQAQLMARELQAKRDEIAQALASQGSLLNADQNRNLQQQLAAYDQAIAEANVGLGQQQIGLGYAGLDLQGELGRGGLALQGQALGQSNDQFLRELALRQWQVGDNSAFNWASL